MATRPRSSSPRYPCFSRRSPRESSFLQGDRPRLASPGGRRERDGDISAPLLLLYGLAAVLNLTNGVITAIWSIYLLKLGASLPVIGLSYTTYTTYAIPTALLTPLVGPRL